MVANIHMNKSQVISNETRICQIDHKVAHSLYYSFTHSFIHSCIHLFGQFFLISCCLHESGIKLFDGSFLFLVMYPILTKKD